MPHGPNFFESPQAGTVRWQDCQPGQPGQPGVEAKI
jgi:hypothetical protein